MTGESLNRLLENLSTGDVQAAEQVFVTYEPYLRKVVRRQLTSRLRAKFDSVDVVQSVMADVVRGFRKAGWRFPDQHHLKAFLLKITRNRLVDRCRQHQTAIKREEPLEKNEPDLQPMSCLPAPSQVVQAKDLWEKMLALCPSEYHDLLWMKRRGFALDQIAQRTGLHEDSIRRILRNLARQLAFHKDPPAADTMPDM